MAQKYNYIIYRFTTEDRLAPTPPQDLINLLESGYEILSSSTVGIESRMIIFILRKLI